ncbi:MAG: PAS domain S-box protein [Halodesulfurarchaeum sp.]
MDSAEPGTPSASETEEYRHHPEEPLTLLLDGAAQVRFASATAADLLGEDVTSLAGRSLESLVAEANWPSLADAISTVREAGQASGIDAVRFETAAGDRLTAKLHLEPFPPGGADEVLVTAQPLDTPSGDSSDAANERFQLALEGANLGVWDWDLETDEVKRDDLLVEMLGYEPGEMGDHIADWAHLVHPEGKKCHDAAFVEHVENRTPYFECEYRMRTSDGDWKWLRTIGKVVERSEDGTPRRAVGIHQDVDDRKRAQLALQEERELFRQGPVVVFQWREEPGWPIEYVSENVEEVLGYATEELETEPVEFANLVHEEDLPSLERQFEKETDGAFFQPDAYRVRTAEGNVRWVLEFTTTREGPDDAGLLGYLVDITQRKAGERKYRNLFEDSRDALMVFDRDGYLDYNRRALDLFGYESGAEFLESTPWDRSPPTQPDGTDSKTKALEYIDRAFEEGEAFFEWRHQRTDGTTFPSEVKLSRFEYEGEAALLALIRDISERKERQRRLEEQRDSLEILNQVLRHDIRNDLSVISGYAELLADHLDGADEEYARTISENADHAVDLTRTGRAMAETMLATDTDLQAVDLRANLEEEIEEVESTAPGAIVRMEGTVPRLDVQADRMLSSVFRNLLKNAVLHNDAEVPVVSVSISRESDTVQVCVADNGPGVPDTEKERIFGKGELGLESRGTGIGLHLVATLLDRYGGDVWVEDREPRGSVFVVELRLAGEPPEA